MTEVERINDQIIQAYQGEPWLGFSVKDLLADVTPEQAARRPIPDAHTIGELVGHISAWQQIARRRLEGEAVNDIADDLNFPGADGTEDCWRAILQALDESTHALSQRVAKLSDDELSQIVPGKSYSIYFLLHGVVQHTTYHAGQIMMLKKLG